MYSNVLPATDVHIAIAESNLGLAYNRENKFTQAEPYLNYALSVYEGNHDSAGTLNVLKALASNYQHTNNKAKLSQIMSQIQALSKSAQPSTNP